jgi:fluoroacetyl-CoA thioesterase
MSCCQRSFSALPGNQVQLNDCSESVKCANTPGHLGIHPRRGIIRDPATYFGLPMPSNELKPGLRASTEILVGTRDTAHHVGSGKIKVLATPVMIMLLEEAALNAVEDLLPRGYQSVGTHLDVSHTAATPVGMRVKAFAEVTEVAGRKLAFRVWAEDEVERIAEGTHERIVVEVERFDKRARAKTDRSAR